MIMHLKSLRKNEKMHLLILQINVFGIQQKMKNIPRIS